MRVLTHRLHDGHRLHRGPRVLEVQGGVVTRVELGNGAGVPAAGEPVGPLDLGLPAGWTLAPGLVDVHCHGGGGADFAEAADDPAVVQRVLTVHRGAGTTSSMASLVSAPVPALRAQVQALLPALARGELLGVHLEGPWLAAAHRGAHAERHLGTPAEGIEEILTLLERVHRAAPGALRMVTLAPELPGSLEAVRRLSDRGVVVAVGHTGADHATVRAALAAGATLATHLFNAMAPVHHREPGPVVALLEDQRVGVELIADGVHLHPSVLAHALRAAGDRVVLVTDAMAAAGQPDGRYRLGELEVEVVGGVARVAGSSTIAGSTLTLGRAVRHALDAAGADPQSVLRAATSAPAERTGAVGVGVLVAGGRADLVLLDEQWEVRGVMRQGEWIRPPRMPQ